MTEKTVTLENEQGQEFEATEVMAITLDRDLGSLQAGDMISILKDDENNLYPFLVDDDNSVKLIEDDEVLDMIEATLEVLLPERDE